MYLLLYVCCDNILSMKKIRENKDLMLNEEVWIRCIALPRLFYFIGKTLLRCSDNVLASYEIKAPRAGCAALRGTKAGLREYMIASVSKEHFCSVIGRCILSDLN